jgi:hypothetical protein
MRLRSVPIGESGLEKSLRLSPFPLGLAPIRCSVGCQSLRRAQGGQIRGYLVYLPLGERGVRHSAAMANVTVRGVGP